MPVICCSVHSLFWGKVTVTPSCLWGRHPCPSQVDKWASDPRASSRDRRGQRLKQLRDGEVKPELVRVAMRGCRQEIHSCEQAEELAGRENTANAAFWGKEEGIGEREREKRDQRQRPRPDCAQSRNKKKRSDAGDFPDVICRSSACIALSFGWGSCTLLINNSLLPLASVGPFPRHLKESWKSTKVKDEVSKVHLWLKPATEYYSRNRPFLHRHNNILSKHSFLFFF